MSLNSTTVVSDAAAVLPDAGAVTMNQPTRNKTWPLCHRKQPGTTVVLVDEDAVPPGSAVVAALLPSCRTTGYFWP